MVWALGSWTLKHHSYTLVLFDVKLLLWVSNNGELGRLNTMWVWGFFRTFVVRIADNEWLLFQTLQAAELIDSEFRAGMSSRQKNKAKRMAKLFAKQRSRDAVEANEKRYNIELFCSFFQPSLNCNLIYLLTNFLQSLPLNILCGNCVDGRTQLLYSFSVDSIKNLAVEESWNNAMV